MNDTRFENAFPRVPPAVHARVASTLNQVKTARRGKPVATLVLAAVLVLTLAGAAYAAIHSGVLTFLLRDGEPSEQQQNMVQAVGMTHENNGITTTVADAVFDGRTLSLGLQFNTPQNLFTVVDSVTFNGVEGYIINDNLSDMWLADPFTACDGVFERGLTATIDKAYFEAADRDALERLYRAVEADERVMCNVSGHLLAANQKPVRIDLYGDDPAAMWRAVDAAVASGDTPVSTDEPYEVLTGSAALGDEFDPSQPGGFILGDADAYVNYANMRVLDTFTFTFSLAASVKAESLAQAEALNPPLNDGRVCVTFEEVRATPLSVSVRFDIAPVEGGWSNEEIAATYRSFACYSESGEPLLLNRYTVATGSAGLTEQPDGTLLYQARLTLGPLSEYPARIELVPFNEDSKDPLWDYAIPVSLPRE